MILLREGLFGGEELATEHLLHRDNTPHVPKKLSPAYDSATTSLTRNNRRVSSEGHVPEILHSTSKARKG